ncbi:MULTISPECIES: hypothetical protein [Pseudomonas]|uniref:Uncharacterized protein n=1 Tax=Pseudomonas eucalypticola TaxID=2599595 RepID=A0A7D5H2K5_9PSED|nr:MULTISPECIES: hypothetical protein [Pseudomonas]QKZ06607.1 hypothetical protein HWQ56_23645 [Pseudomonas eucalypticola]
MSDPRDKAAATPPPTVGEGCLSRYDPQALSDEDGTDFPGAEQLWEETHPQEGDALE